MELFCSWVTSVAVNSLAYISRRSKLCNAIGYLGNHWGERRVCLWNGLPAHYFTWHCQRWFFCFSLRFSLDVSTLRQWTNTEVAGCLAGTDLISPIMLTIGTLSNDDDNNNNNNNVKKQLFLRAKQLLCTCIMLFSTFLWRPLHDYDVKPPNATFNWGRGHMTTNFPFSI